MEYYYSAIKRNKPDTWMNLKVIMLRKKKTVSNDYILYDSIYITLSK